jgi:hypothetical protein
LYCLSFDLTTFDYSFGIFKLFVSLNRGRHREPLNSNSLNMLYIDSKTLKVTITRILIILKDCH